jgi:hypothetical protein
MAGTLLPDGAHLALALSNGIILSSITNLLH